jgi:transposase-like protein
MITKPSKFSTMPKQSYDSFFSELLSSVSNMTDFESVMGDLYKQGIHHLLESEMSHFLGYDKHDPAGNGSGNSRNGTSPKKLKTTKGEISLQVPRDRNGEFHPVIVPKGQSTTDKIESVIVGLYARGMSTQDITQQIQEIYGLDVSRSFISDVTTKMTGHIESWQNRPLEATWCMLWMDCIVVKVRKDNRIVNKSIYIVLGLKQDGLKEVLGLWIHESESASFWMSVLNDLKARGVQRIFIACTDNLTGFVSAIEATFPDTVCQLCVVHQIRNSMRYVPWKDRKQFLRDLKSVYGAVNLDEATRHFEAFKERWNPKYAYAIKSWEANWQYLTSFFDFPQEIRKIMYTTNAIEALNRNIRKFIKTKSIFPSDQAAVKSVFLAIEQVQRKWTMPVRNWALVLNQILIKFEIQS